MSITMDEEIKRWTAKRKTALIMDRAVRAEILYQFPGIDGEKITGIEAGALANRGVIALPIICQDTGKMNAVFVDRSQERTLQCAATFH